MNEDCLKLTVYFGERERAGGAFLADALVDLFARHDFQTSVLLRGAEGFGAVVLATNVVRRTVVTA